MAREQYTPTQSIRDMTTRQLREYIYVHSREAEARIESMDLKEAPKYVQDLAREITYSSGKVIKSSSNMSKVEMLEHAYALRDFNAADTESKYARDVEWKQNKQRYESFIRNRIAEGDSYWDKFLTSKGNVSKRGYKEYKDYIDFIKGIQDYKAQFGYRTLMQYAEVAMKQGKTSELKDINKLLSEVFAESRGKGFSQAQLIERFELKLNELNEKEAKKAKALPKVKAKKPKKSKSNIRTKKGRKMKESGTVRERLT